MMWSNAHPPIRVAMTMVSLISKTGYNQAGDNEWIFIFNGLGFQLGTANWIAVTQRWPVFLLWLVPRNDKAWDSGRNKKQAVSPCPNKNSREGSTPESFCVAINMEENSCFQFVIVWGHFWENSRGGLITANKSQGSENLYHFCVLRQMSLFF